MHSFKTEDFLHRVALGLESAQTLPELKDPLASYGYDNSRLQEGVKLHKSVIALQVQQAEARSMAKEATATFQEGREGLEMIYRRHVAIARVAFDKDSIAWKKLQLDGKRKRSIAGTQLQAHLFYTHLVEYLDHIEKYNLQKKEVQETNKLLEQLISLQVLQQQAKSRAQTLTQMKDENLELLVSWWRRFTKTARLAFESTPHYLEALGMNS
uniref:Uncharacterized protein n=1 Tax=Roseihalotalea indica TaxID=2867963 RepID=A0AA49JC46_9BACT|nr:hypothetical protein K4G66_23350 [Tunicatimonas sp. TK19036]